MNNKPAQQRLEIQDRVEIDCQKYWKLYGAEGTLKEIRENVDRFIVEYGPNARLQEDYNSRMESSTYYVVLSERMETDEEYEERMNKIKKEAEKETKKKEEAKIESARAILEANGYKIEKDTFGEFGYMAVEDDK